MRHKFTTFAQEVRVMYIYTTDDKKEFEYAFHGIDFLLCLWDMDQWLRSEIKYSQKEEYQPVRDQLWEIMQHHGVNLDMLE